jgi:hypothetical protein
MSQENSFRAAPRTDPLRFNAQICALKEFRCRFLVVGQDAKLVGDRIEAPGEKSHSNSRQRGDGGSSRVKGFSDLSERDKRYVISGAVFLIGLAGLIAIFCVSWYRTRPPASK